MKIRQAKKILNMMAKGTDTRYFDSKYTFKKESRFIPRLKNLYQKATIRWNKVNMPSANVSLFRSILRTSKECSRCKHFNGMLAGRCTKLHNNIMRTSEYGITSSSVYNEGAIYFKNKEDAQAVIDNPNFRSILDAIYKD